MEVWSHVKGTPVGPLGSHTLLKVAGFSVGKLSLTP